MYASPWSRIVLHPVRRQDLVQRVREQKGKIMRSFPHLVVSGFLLAASLVCPTVAGAESVEPADTQIPSPAKASSSIGSLQAALAKANASTVLRRMGKFYSEFKTFQATLVSNTTVVKGGKTEERTATYAVFADRPGKLAIILKDGPGNGTVVTGGPGLGTESSTGGEAYFYFVPKNAYVKMPAPASYRSLMDTTSYKLTCGYALGSSLIELLLDDRAADIVERLLARMTYIGQENVDGYECHRMRLDLGPFKQDIFIDAGEKPWLRRVTMDASAVMKNRGQKIEGTTSSDGQGDKVELNVYYHNPVVNEVIPASTFSFTPPATAKLVNSFVPDRPQPKEEVHPLVNKPAPPALLTLLDGRQVALSSLRGKKVIVLDFWATWCGPCRRSLPLISQLAEAYQPKGVAFFAVDLQEQAGQVSEFLEKQPLAMPVALDSDGKVADQFQAAAIPQTVVIGKDGVVRAVHVGYKPNLDELLAPALDKLLAQVVPPSPPSAKAAKAPTTVSRKAQPTPTKRAPAARRAH